MRSAIGPRNMAVAVTAVILALMFSGARSAAQTDGLISGIVFNQATKLGLEGAEVRIIGTARSTVSGRHGEYQFRGVTPGLYEVEARRVGYLPYRDDSVAVEPGGISKAYLVLRPVAAVLEDVVTMAGGVEGAELIVPARDPVRSMQGKVAGVAVMGSGRPGDEALIQLRAATSIRGSNRPLIIIDGVTLATGQGSTVDLSALDIESIEVLKGASASAMYGSRGGAGVIIIRTRRGRG